MSPDDFVQFTLRQADYTHAFRSTPHIEGLRLRIASVRFAIEERQTIAIERVKVPSTIASVYNNILSDKERQNSTFSLQAIGDIEYEGAHYVDMPLLNLDFREDDTQLSSCIYPFDKNLLPKHLSLTKHDGSGLAKLDYPETKIDLSIPSFIHKIEDLKTWTRFRMSPSPTPINPRSHLRLVVKN